MFKKILIANRGEIALRIIRACKELGIHTVAVYSEADRPSLHVRYADEAVCIGKSESSKSYLNIQAIVSAAEVTDAEAIHPGYGFFAENDHFADVCESCNIKFIGPAASSIRLMGNKSAAKDLCRKIQVPLVKGSEGTVKTIEEAKKIAEEVGYPILVKASAGGGGKGIREAHTPLALSNVFFTTKTEAEASFGNGDVYIEKLILEPRHIEFQIIADQNGNCVHLGERDCTIQRRHQKLIEESPSPVISSEQRRRMGSDAVKIAKEAGYVNAGTVEFLVDKDLNYYFMEMNTRIQVEHPVTEVITKMDLIKEQIRIAAGEKLSFRQEDIKINGHAFEARINAEDWENGFRPSPGMIHFCHLPGGRNVRMDSHIYSGYVIPPFYDSMIGKLITWGRDRKEAIRTMERALDELVIEGIKTTVPLTKRIFHDGNFISGAYSTSFMKEFMESSIQK
ncbi:MAG: acetyl-CoA carboxylase biotin carboxylase subunit [Candidatus Aureabacteria bacterium]|nr:acetyl-CoA carboxylase biotin carboxylase subunit [Candidatus Auribacterota bacterium]